MGTWSKVLAEAFRGRKTRWLWRRLEQYDIFFVETPLPLDDLEGYRRLAGATDIGARFLLSEQNTVSFLNRFSTTTAPTVPLQQPGGSSRSTVLYH